MGNLPLSVCILVKDDGKYLTEAIESVEGIASEVVIINSPLSPLFFSSEKKRGLEEKIQFTSLKVSLFSGLKAGREGDLVGEFFSHWNNDFSAARNFALEKATQSWILILDSDSALDPLCRDELSRCLGNTENSLYYLKLISHQFSREEIQELTLKKALKNDYQYVKPYLEKGNEIITNKEELIEVHSTNKIKLTGALFRNGKGIKFKGRVFEQLTGISGLKSENADINIYQYRNITVTEEKQITTKLLMLSTADNISISERLFYQSKLLTLNFSDPNIKENINRFNIVLRENRVEAERFESWYFESTNYLLDNNNLGLCLNILVEATDKYPESVGLFFNFYRLLYKIAKIFECIEILKYIIYLVNKIPTGKIGFEQGVKPPCNSLSPEMTIPALITDTDYLNYLLAVCYFELSDESASLFFYNQIKDSYKYNSQYQELLALNINMVKNIEGKIATGNNFTLLYLKLAREYVRHQQYEKALPLYLQTLEKSAREKDFFIEKYIYCDLLLNAKMLNTDSTLINQIIEKEKILSKGFSFFQYSLGKYYLSVGNSEKALTAFQKALQIENELEGSLPYLQIRARKIDEPFIDLVLTGMNDPVSKDNVLQSINTEENPEKMISERFNIVNQGFFRYMYDDNISLLKYCFEDLGIEYHLSNFDLKKDYINIILAAYSSPEFTDYASEFTYILYQMEQMALSETEDSAENETYQSYLGLLKNALSNWDYSQENIRFLKTKNLNNITFLPFAYHEKMEVIDQSLGKDIDVLFYGGITPRRIKLIDLLAEKGYKTKYLWNLFGKERNNYIARAKIILNAGLFSPGLLAEQRLSFLLNNRCFVISETPLNTPSPTYNQGIVFNSYDKLVETCEYYLKPENTPLRQNIADKGYELFKKDKMVEKLKQVLTTKLNQ
jgi:hypothetical protein